MRARLFARLSRSFLSISARSGYRGSSSELFSIKSRLISRISSSQGVTLIEILFSIAILAIGMAGSISLHASSIHGEKFAAMIGNCTLVASDAIDRIVSNRDIIDIYNGLRISATNNTATSSNPMVGKDIEEISKAMKFLDFDTGNVSIGILVDIPLQGLYTVKVNVDYKYKGNSKKCYSETVI